MARNCSGKSKYGHRIINEDSYFGILWLLNSNPKIFDLGRWAGNIFGDSQWKFLHPSVQLRMLEPLYFVRLLYWHGLQPSLSRR